jgi:peptide-methionine (S)-S-oxide reductase
MTDLIRSTQRMAALAGAALLLLSLSAASFPARAKTPASPTAPAAKAPAAVAKAVFAGGCFWCEEATFEGRRGVLSVVSGYTGGTQDHPTYEEVSSGRTGHAESVEVTYDPKVTTYAALLDIYWHNVDPTQANGQFCDHGTQYRSAIFYAGEAQHRAALASKRAIEASRILKRPIVTEIAPFTTFWPAEDYHQDYYKKNPVNYQTYRLGCGRDRTLREVWGAKAGGHQPATAGAQR